MREIRFQTPSEVIDIYYGVPMRTRLESVAARVRGLSDNLEFVLTVTFEGESVRRKYHQTHTLHSNICEIYIKIYPVNFVSLL